jgi:hypothetical protein
MNSEVIAQLTPKRGAKAPEVPLPSTVSTYIWIGEMTPCTGTPTLTVNGAESTAVNAAESVGVKEPVNTVAPPAAGTHEHFDTKGVTVVVAIASQPVITTPAAENLTLPGALAVATMIAGSSPNVAFPPVITKVGNSAALADAPALTPATSTNEHTARLEMIFFIHVLL